LMEGAYNKTLERKTDSPSDLYSLFLEQLLLTVRNEVAECIEAAYDRISVSEAARLLGIGSYPQFVEFIGERKWTVEGSNGSQQLVFSHSAERGATAEVPVLKQIQQQLGYAVELERIV